MKNAELEYDFDFEAGRYHVLYLLKPEDEIDMSLKQMLEYKEHPYLVPFAFEHGENGGVFRYDIAETINMMAWRQEVSELELNSMKTKIKMELKELEKKKIPIKSLLSEKRFQFVDSRTGDVRFICLPLVSEESSMIPDKAPTPVEKPKNVWEEAPVPDEKPKNVWGKMPVPDEKPKNVWEEAPNSFGDVSEPLPQIPPMPGMMSFSGEDSKPLEGDDFINRLFGKHKEEAPVSVPEEITEHEKPVIDEPISFDDIVPLSGDEPEPSFLDEPEPGFLDEPEPSFLDDPDITIDADDSATFFLKTRDDEDGTVLLGTVKKKAVLTRLSTREEFELTEEEYRIGKKASVVDVCIQNNPTISRLHCVIRFKKGEFYLEDMKSLNGTYLDDVQLLPENSVKLPRFCKIQMSDEEFLFQVK